MVWYGIFTIERTLTFSIRVDYNLIVRRAFWYSSHAVTPWVHGWWTNKYPCLFCEFQCHHKNHRMYHFFWCLWFSLNSFIKCISCKCRSLFSFCKHSITEVFSLYFCVDWRKFLTFVFAVLFEYYISVSIIAFTDALSVTHNLDLVVFDSSRIFCSFLINIYI